MPPRASLRQRSRTASREPDATPAARGGLSAFQKPNLPPLQGTPSSRRQYSYGAAAEPLPSRPGRGLQRGQVLDLSNAVRSVLTRHDEEDLRGQDSPPSRVQSQSIDPDDDELAGASEAASNIETAPRGSGRALRATLLRGPAIAGSETDDARSFGIESDYYGDATIGSTPGSMQPPSAFRTSENPGPTSLSSKSRVMRPRQPRLQNLAEESSSESQYEPEASETTSQTTKTRRTKSTMKQQAETTHPPRRGGRNGQETTEDMEQIQDGQPVKKMGLRHESKTDTLGTDARGHPATSKSRAAPATPPESEARTGNQGPDSASAAAGELESTKARRGRSAASKLSLAATEASRVGAGVSDSGNDDSSESGRWLSRTTSMLSQLSPSSSAQGDNAIENEGYQDALAINWWQLLNPWTYVKATAWIVEATWEWLVGLFQSIFSAARTQLRLLSALQVLPYIIVALVLGLALSSAVIASFRDGAVGELWFPVPGAATLLSFGGITSRIGDYLPAASWLSRSRRDDFADLFPIDDTQRATMDSFLEKVERAFHSLEKSDKLHEGSLRKLEAVVPKVVHMQLKDGKPIIAPEFWHALRDLIREDGTFLTIERKGSEYVVGSERQLRAIAASLMGDPTFTSKLNLTVGAVESRLSNSITGFWETWVKDNDAKVKQTLGSAVEQVTSAASQRDFDERLAKSVKEQIGDNLRRGMLVSRDEYLRHVEKEFAAHRSEISAELAELRPQLKKLVQESVDLANRDVPPSMDRAALTSLVHGLVRKAFADMNLEAMAKGKIHAHWDAELKHQVNYFALGAGAIFDKGHSSVTHARPVSEKTLLGDLPGMTALMPWHDEGQCWCAARSRSPRGNPHGARLAVQMGHFIVPQHLVVEHILPGATTDPGARPRHMEIYASIDDDVVRERVRDFAATHFPDDEDDWDYAPPDLPSSFVKISQFVYDGAELHDGIHVHRLSSELLALGAETDHVVVRAVTNYGAPTHTCFYRLRLYGYNVELEGHGDAGGLL